jgi:hypothetical protein
MTPGDTGFRQLWLIGELTRGDAVTPGDTVFLYRLRKLRLRKV